MTMEQGQQGQQGKRGGSAHGDLETEVVAVGSGSLTAALVAHDAGRRGVVLEDERDGLGRQRLVGDMSHSNPKPGAVDEPPFYGVRLVPVALLDLGAGYPSGTSNMRAIAWGYVAGRHLARREGP